MNLIAHSGILSLVNMTLRLKVVTGMVASVVTTTHRHYRIITSRGLSGVDQKAVKACEGIFGPIFRWIVWDRAAFYDFPAKPVFDDTPGLHAGNLDCESDMYIQVK
jgi:hypothetical protein